MRIEDLRPGQAVVYVPRHGAREDGVVTGLGERYAFVRFANQHPTADAKACDPRDLEAADGVPQK